MSALSSIELDWAIDWALRIFRRLAGASGIVIDSSDNRGHGGMFNLRYAGKHTHHGVHNERHFRAAGKLRIMHIPIFRRAASAMAGLDGNFRLRRY